MRIVALLLLLANLTLYAYTRLDNASVGEAARLSQQVHPDAIKLLTPQQVAALGPSKVAALANVCIEWSPLNEADRARAMADLDPLALGRLLTQRKIDAEMSYWVYLPKLVNKAAADKRMAELVKGGIKDASIVDSGPQRFAIALGAFRTEAAAQAYVQALADKGVANAKAEARVQTLSRTALMIRDPEATVVAKLKTLQAGYPDTELKIGSCDKSA